MKKYIFFTILAVCMALSRPVLAADEPMPFEKFFKKEMKVTPGIFPVYQDGAKYYLEIPAAYLKKDILVVGDIARGFANEVSQSSGIINFDLGTNNNLNVTRQVYKANLSPEYNNGMEALIQKSNLVPVSFVLKIDAFGKNKKSYIIDITNQLIAAGELFSFKGFDGLSRSDALRSGVQKITAAEDGVVFSVTRTQTDQVSPNQSSSRTVDRANTYIVNLTIQRLSPDRMVVREADPRVGFSTVSFSDFGKKPYAVSQSKVIRKWDIEVGPKDVNKYRAGTLVSPLKPIKVFIDKATPALFLPYIRQGVLAWNSAFAAAGFKDVLVISDQEQDNWLSSGKILVKWGNAFENIGLNVLDDPRTGEILTAKMNVSEDMADFRMASYFVQCGLIDNRILKNINDQDVRGEILRWKVTQALGELLGLKPNFAGSTAYSVDELRSDSWLQKNSISASVTDDLPFNYVVQPGDKVAVANLIPRISHYDKMAIGWGYRVFQDKNALKTATNAIAYNDNNQRYLDENKNDPFTRKGDLSSDQVAAARLAMNNMMVLRPQLAKITAEMTGGDDDWQKYIQLAAGFQNNYDRYLDNVAAIIGGESSRVMIRNYNDTPVVYVSKKQQKAAFEFLNDYLFTGIPGWMQDKVRANTGNSELVSARFQRSAERVLNNLISPDLIRNLEDAGQKSGNELFTLDDLFASLDHYVFKDYDAVKPIDAYSMLLQTNFIYNLSQAAAKDNIVGGLTDSNEVIHLYFISVMKKISVLSESHQDADARAHYKLIKLKVEKDLGQQKDS